MEKVSVCIITYNHEKYISKCIESVLEQATEFKFEVIVIEDRSTDRTKEILQKYKELPSVKIIFREKNTGVLNNYQTAFDLATGEYIAFLDGDDYMLPGKLQAQARVLDSNPEIAICSHPLIYFEEINGSIKSKIPLFYSENKRYTIKNLLEHGFVFSHSSKMFRKKSLPESGVDLNTKNCTDYLLHLQNSLHGDIMHLNTPLGAHRVHRASLSQKNKNGKSLRDSYNDQIYGISVIEKTLNELGRLDTSMSKSINKARNRVFKWFLKRKIRSLLKV